MEREDDKTVDQLAYLTNQRVEVAKQTIALRSAENELKNASAQRAQARLDARDAQIRKLQESLNAKQTDRGTLVTFGDVLFDFNKAELKSSAYPNITKLAQFLQKTLSARSSSRIHRQRRLGELQPRPVGTTRQQRAHGPGTRRCRPGTHRRPGLRQGVPSRRQWQQHWPRPEPSGGGDHLQ